MAAAPATPEAATNASPPVAAIKAATPTPSDRRQDQGRRTRNTGCPPSVPDRLSLRASYGHAQVRGLYGARSLATEFLSRAVNTALSTDTLEVSQRIKMLSIPSLSPDTLGLGLPDERATRRGLGKPVHLPKASPSARSASLRYPSGVCPGSLTRTMGDR